MVVPKVGLPPGGSTRAIYIQFQGDRVVVQCLSRGRWGTLETGKSTPAIGSGAFVHKPLDASTGGNYGSDNNSTKSQDAGHAIQPNIAVLRTVFDRLCGRSVTAGMVTPKRGFRLPEIINENEATPQSARRNATDTALRPESKTTRNRNDRLPGCWYSRGKWEKATMTYLSDRITIDPEQCGGRPCVRGMRIRVTDVLDLYSAGLNANQILEEMPDLEEADLKACLQYASKRIDHPVLAA